MLGYVQTGYLFGTVFAGMQRKASRMREAFEHRCAVPIRKGYDLSIRINGNRILCARFDRGCLCAISCFRFSTAYKSYAAATAPALHKRLNRSSVFPLIEEITCLLPLYDIDLKL
ncbi:hypothetical protein D3C80_1881120 [compost metagenome]